MEYVTNKNNVSFIKKTLDCIDENHIDIMSAFFSMGIGLLRQNGIYEKKHVAKVLAEYSDIPVDEELSNLVLPKDEFDILGLLYQSYLQEGDKNIAGSYYTPQKIACNMTKDFAFSNGELFFDPCCGSGAFLLSAAVRHPNQLFGVDSDRIAVFVAKLNLLVKYSDIEFEPQIYCLDYLMGYSVIQPHPVFLKCFDYIATNPPWGGMDNRWCDVDAITSNETFSCFFVKAYDQLKASGTIRYLFPEAILNVKVHKDIRKFIIEKAGLISITIYDDVFSGVMTKYVDIKCGKDIGNREFSVYADGRKWNIDIRTIYETDNLIFNLLSNDDLSIVRMAKEKGKYFLRDSVWGLGIVTGDNKRKLFPEYHDGMEMIYTGKEIQPYTLKQARYYILFNRAELQQVAKDEVYRAQEKLVYKFISNRLVFAYDASQSLFLNSANILVPSIPGMSIKTVMAFLNSDLFQFLYLKLFGEVKILKGNLAELPFPEISVDMDKKISELVDAVLNGETAKRDDIESIIFAIFGFSDEQKNYIRRNVNGKTD